jgi:uncharacterized protein DUF1569
MKSLARERDRLEVQRRVRALNPDSIRRWGKMTVHQMVCHLSDGYRMLTGEKPTALVASPLPRPIMKCVALYVPLTWPKNIETTTELDQRFGGTRPGTFDADVAELGRLLDQIAVERRDRLEGQVHPIFGRMSERSWLRWAYLHADHHLRQFSV